MVGLPDFLELNRRNHETLDPSRGRHRQRRARLASLTGSLKNLIAPPGLKPVAYAPSRSGWSVQDTMATDTKSGGTGQRSAPAPRPALLGSPNRALFTNTLPGHFSYVEER